MLEWILQWNAYVPALLNVRAPDAPAARVSVVQAGSYPFHCKIHPNMTGTIEVTG